ncbi:trans-sulfuration enzyme family protein [Paenibacillus beijingensis]|uniref:homocysteine desulfhydrase n=1 Tax=Paenibacillus beijingensis TaxID=1126833 RepID=A0A0D5NPB2_9BACL|nr:aminotransferase class I/II-fold pyridoxal phosphate-dependent enzyme [Paenibacillus beijingensis]AJY77015.1 hypothetical protein VN24_23740 [Paenibacillus beijingensis]
MIQQHSIHGETTNLLHLGEENNDRYMNSVVPPIFQTSLFTSSTYEEFAETINHGGDSYCYTRYGNPNFDILCRKMADLEQGDEALLTSSGVSAISIAIMAQIQIGDHIIAISNLYGPTRSLLDYLEDKMNVQVTYVTGEHLYEFEEAMQPNTRLVVLESPASVTFCVQDLRGISNLCRSRGVVTVIDNSYSSPIFQKPLKLGIDVVVHSATKYLSGHSDTIGGVIVANKPHMPKIRKQHKIAGSSPAPFEAWLILRGMRTLPIRMKEHSKCALAVASFLEAHPKVRSVNYPGLPSFRQHALAKSQMSGFSSLFSFEIDAPKERMAPFFNSLRLIKIGLSWGGYESICVPSLVSFGKGIDEEQFAKIGITHQLVRLHVGLENADDLMEDLSQALQQV